ncbi:uncharacterized protein V6R79_001705 [Siganus canaliculatus]
MQWEVIVWVRVLLWAWTLVPGSLGLYVHQMTPSYMPQVRQSLAMSAAELEFLLQRKQIAVKSLETLGVNCAPDSVPHIAILGSGGGQRAAVGLIGSLYQLAHEGLLDAVTYLGGNSGSAWAMSLLYSDHYWSTNMAAAVSRLFGPNVPPDQALAWLDERAKDPHFSLSDIWGLYASAAIMKQLDRRRLSMDGKNPLNPYPIYNTVNKNCLHQGSMAGRWFEMTPDECGFTDLGLFISTSHLGSRLHALDLEGKGPEMDMIQLHGLVGSALADEKELKMHLPDWLKGLVDSAANRNCSLLDALSLWTEAPGHHSSVVDFLDLLIRVRAALLKLTYRLKNKASDNAVLTKLKKLELSLKATELFFSGKLWKAGPAPQMLFLQKQQQKLEEYAKSLLDTQTAAGAAVHQQVYSLPDASIKHILRFANLIYNNTNDPVALSKVDQLKALLQDKIAASKMALKMRSFGPTQKTQVIHQWHKDLKRDLHNWFHNLPLAQEIKRATQVIHRVFHLLAKWEWGTTENFLHNPAGAAVPPCIKHKEHLQLVDSGFMLNTPYPPFLGPKRDIDLIIVLNYGAFETFETLDLAKQYAASMNKTFPEIPASILMEKDWPRSCYVFEGNGNGPTIVYMPLFNRDNSRDEWEIKAKMEMFGTFQPPYTKDKIQYLLEVAKANIRRNKAGLVSQILKAADHRYKKS